MPLPLPLSRPVWRHSGRVCVSLATWRGKALSLSIGGQREKVDRLPDLAAELMRLKVDIIFLDGSAINPCRQGSNFHDSNCHGV